MVTPPGLRERPSFPKIYDSEETFEFWQELAQWNLEDKKVLALFAHPNCIGVAQLSTGVPKAIVTPWIAIMNSIWNGQIVLCGHHASWLCGPTYVYAAAPGSGWCERCSGRARVRIMEVRERKRLPYSMCDGCDADLTAEISLRHYSVVGPYLVVFTLCGKCAYDWHDDKVAIAGEGPPR